MEAAPKHVLIVDDEESLLEMMAEAVRRRGYAVETALNGLEALEILDDVTCDVVVTDLKMPILDGSSLISDLLENGHTPRVIVITGYATLDGAIDCLRKGAVDFLVKPFDMEEFLGSVDKAMDQPGRGSGWSGEVDWASLKKEFDLTRSQVAALSALYKTGKSNRDLAVDLCLSPDTVKSHLRIAFHKLKISNRTQFFLLINDWMRTN